MKLNRLFWDGIDEKIKSYNESLSRGIYYREKENTKGAYNQDFDTHTMLIELGSQDNTLEEISNTIEILAQAISSYVKENV